MSKNRQRYRIQKSKRRRRVFLFLITPILLLALGATSYGAFLYNKAQSVMNDSYKPVERETKREEDVDPKLDNISVLFIGVDDSETRNFNSGARSDALMLATFNEKAKSIKLLSIPRDSYVYIPELGYDDKITHAHANGGVKSTIETVEGLLDIPVDYYVKMNFNAFIDVIDALNGIEVEVPYELYEKDSKDRKNAIHLEQGLQMLNGEEALALARTRYYDNDIMRGQRQQEILKAIIKRGVSAQAITKYDDVMEVVGKNMETDLSFSNMKSFLDYATTGTSLDIESLTLQGYDDYAGNMYIYALDQEALNQTALTLKTHLGLVNTEVTSAAGDDSTTEDEY